MQITHEQDVNAHLMGEVVVGLPPNEVHVPVIVVEPGYVLSIGVPLSGLIVLLEPTASVSIPDEVLPQCRGLQVFRCILQAREDGVMTFESAPPPPAFVEVPAAPRPAKKTAKKAAKKAKKTAKRPAKKAAKKAKKPAKKTAKKRVAKAKAAKSEPRRSPLSSPSNEHPLDMAT